MIYIMLARQKLKCMLFQNRTDDDDEDFGNDDGDELLKMIFTVPRYFIPRK